MAKKRANGEGSIRKRKDGRWEGRYTAGHDSATGKTIYKNVLGRTQAEVKEKLKRAIEDSAKLDMSKVGQYTVALQNGVDIKTVSGMLGHFSAGFTLDTYAHVTTAAQKEAANTMEKVLANANI